MFLMILTKNNYPLISLQKKFHKCEKFTFCTGIQKSLLCNKRSLNYPLSYLLDWRDLATLKIVYIVYQSVFCMIYQQKVIVVYQRNNYVTGEEFSQPGKIFQNKNSGNKTKILTVGDIKKTIVIHNTITSLQI